MNQSLLMSSSTPFLSARKPSPPVGGKVISRNDKRATNDSFPSHAFFPKRVSYHLLPPPSSLPLFLYRMPFRDYLYPSVPKINISTSHPFKTVTKPTKSSYLRYSFISRVPTIFPPILLQISETSPSPIILHPNPLSSYQNSFHYPFHYSNTCI